MVIKLREFVVKSSHRDRPILSNIAFFLDRRPPALVSYAHKRRGGIAGPIRTGFRIECLICTDVADNPGTLVGKSCEG